MSRPHPSLVDVAAGRPAVGGPGIARSAIEHRMGGVLLSASEDGHITLPPGETVGLIASDLAAAARHRQLWAVLTSAIAALADRGIEALVIKGVANEARWYRRPGERPCADVDLVLAPCCVDRIDEALAVLAPSYPLVAVATDLVRRRQLQHVHFSIGDVPIDLHLDPLKLGVWLRRPESWWSTRTTIVGPEGGPIFVLAPEIALVSALTHLNKDRFAYLGAYAEVARIVQDPAIDWDRLESFVSGEGLEVPVWASLHEVVDRLGLPVAVPEVGGWRRRAWESIWPPDGRLVGDEGWGRHRKRQVAIPFLIRSRGRDAVEEWRRVALPSPDLLAIHGRPVAGRGGYLRRITVDRLPGR